MRASVPATDLGQDLDVAAVRGLVVLLCDARLVAVLAILLRGFLSGSDSAAGVWVVLLAVPMSGLPLRRWSRSPRFLSRSGLFVGIDTLVSVVVIAGAIAAARAWELGVAYLLLSAALSGTLARRGTAVLSAALVAMGTVVFLTVLGLDLVWIAFIPLCALGVAYAASSVSRQLRNQSVLARGLLAAKAAEAAQHERAELAREMHDSLAKTLHGVEMLVTVLSEELDAHASPEADTARLARSACATARKEARDVLAGLRGADSTEVLETLRLEVVRWSEFHGIAADVDISPEAERFELCQVRGYHLQRVLGELLENVAKHAGATQVRVAGRVVDSALEITVSDNGRGIALRDDADLALHGHFGLIGIRERLSLIGSRLSIESDPSRGTSMTVRVPDNDRIGPAARVGITEEAL